MGNRKIYGYYVIRGLETSEEVHRVAVHAPESSGYADSVERGLALKVDFERFYFGWEDADA